MADDFERYIKGLQELENSECVVSLIAIRDMHLNVLEFFPVIIEGIDRLIKSGAVTPNLIEDIKNLIPELARCKSSYEVLSNSVRSNTYSANISQLLNRKDSISMHEVAIYREELSEMLHKNEQQIYTEKAEAERESTINLSKAQASASNFRLFDNVDLRIFKKKHKTNIDFDVSLKNLQCKSIIIRHNYFDNLSRALCATQNTRYIPAIDFDIVHVNYVLVFERQRGQGTPIIKMQVDVIDEDAHSLISTQTYTFNMPKISV